MSGTCVMPHTRASRWRPRSPERVALGRAIRELRERREVSQFALAYDSGVGRPYVNSIECARVNPTFERLRDLLDTLGYGFSDLAEVYERHLLVIEPESGQRVVRCPSPDALRAQEQHNAEALARARAARTGGRMKPWT
jgi:transcriptional regulator with XRE-family HTH domain